MRLTLRPDSGRARGTLRSLDSAAVVLGFQRGSRGRRFDLGDVESVEVYRRPGATVRTLAGAAAGGLLSGGVFALIHRAFEKSEEDCSLACPHALLTPLFHPAVGAILGAVGGGAIGYQFSPERWDPVPLPGR